MNLTGITRVRNESLIIADTIHHYLKHCDQIILYDDCSTDETINIAQREGGNRIKVIPGDYWRTNRVLEETRHRGLLLDLAKQAGADWCFCFDADERLIGSLPGTPPANCNGYRFRLFDGYLTPQNRGPYSGGQLADLPREWGPEYRDILMMFRVDTARYAGLDQREPIVQGTVMLANSMVKHYGKCLSVDQWEETCDYYATYFPQRYKAKWLARKGKAIHTKSDFGRPLYQWHHLIMQKHAWIKI